MEEVAAAGALPLLVEVLKLHKAESTICEATVGILRKFVMGREALQQAVVTAGALPVLVEMLEVHKANVAICELVSIEIWYLARAELFKASIVNAGAVPVLAAVCKDQLGDARLWSHYTLEKLGYKDNGSKSNPNISLHLLSFPIFRIISYRFMVLMLSKLTNLFGNRASRV